MKSGKQREMQPGTLAEAFGNRDVSQMKAAVIRQNGGGEQGLRENTGRACKPPRFSGIFEIFHQLHPICDAILKNASPWDS
jgi:hypothetical protein